MRSCNHGQGERKRKGCLAVFSNIAHPQIPTNACMDCMYGQHRRAEDSPQIGRVPWRKGIEFSRRKCWNMARRYQRKRLFTLILPSLVLMLAVYMLKSRRLSGSVLSKPESSSAEQATDSWIIAVFCSPSPAHLQRCTCSTVLK